MTASLASSATSQRKLHWARALGIVALMAAAGAAIATDNVQCTFAVATGQPCPGCGSTRSVLALAHGDLATALRMNPLAPVVFATLGALALQVTYAVLVDGEATRVGRTRWSRWTVRILAAAIGLQALVWALRFFGLFGGPVPV